MSTRTIFWYGWELAAEEDRRFRRIFNRTALPILLLMLLVTLVTLPEHPKEQVEYVPPRYAELLPLPPPPPPVVKPPPKEEVPPVEQAKPTPKPPPPKEQEKPKPTPPTPEQKQEQARREAEAAGIKSIQNELSDLRNQTLLDNTPVGETTTNVITTQSAGAPPPAFASAATAGSGGIGRSASVTGSGKGTGLGTHHGGAVHSNLGTGPHAVGPGKGQGRSYEEIQRVFDQNMGSFTFIFNRAARENPAIAAGKIIVDLTIAPDGHVVDCKLVSSTFGDPDLEQKILARVRLLNFGAKSVPVFHYPNYPINYLPQS